MNNYLNWIAAALTTVAATAAGAHVNPGDYNNGSRTIRCESHGKSRNFCRVNTMGGVRLTRQLSKKSCIQGRNWSYNASGISVSNGCRAEFVVGRPRPYRDPNAAVSDTHYRDTSGRLIHCESTASGRTYCGDSHNRYSMGGNRDPDCIEGRTWGTDGRGVWVSGDCDADFNSMPYDNRDGYNDPNDGYNDRNDGYNDPNDRYDDRDGGYNSGVVNPNTEVEHSHYVDSNGQVIHCQSTADGRNYCGDRDSRYIMSGTRDQDCVEGVTYGYDQRGLWVSGDCDAQFTLDESYDRQR